MDWRSLHPSRVSCSWVVRGRLWKYWALRRGFVSKCDMVALSVDVVPLGGWFYVGVGGGGWVEGGCNLVAE